MATSAPHLSMLKMMRKDTGVENLESDPAKTVATAEKRYNASSMRVALTALRKEYPDNKFFIAEMKRRYKGWKESDQSQDPTEKQIEKYISWDNIIKFRDEDYDKMNPTERLLLALYTYIPPVRIDYTPMKVVTRKPTKFEDGTNYLVLTKSPYFVFHAYKTHALYGDKTVKIPKKLEMEIRLYLDAHPGSVYLFEEGGKPWSEQRLSLTFRRIFQKYQNMDTGVSMVRHAYATKFHKGQRPLADIKKTAESMLHGPLQSMSYRFIALENEI